MMDKDKQSVTQADYEMADQYRDRHGLNGLNRDHLADLIAHIRLASQPTSAEDAWRPIETFVDGEEYEDGILICDATKPSPSVGVARFLGDKWMGFDQSFGVECFYPTPTHWMPLPAAPALSTAQGERA